MVDDSLSLLTTAAEWPWIGIILILVATLVSVGVILVITRRQILGVVRESSKMALGVTKAKFSVSAGDRHLTTTGRGQVIWTDEGYTMTMVRRFPGISQSHFDRDIDIAISELTTSLTQAGIEPSDIVEGERSMLNSEVGQVLVDVSVRDAGRGQHFHKSALSIGFTEASEARRAQITFEEAHVLAGQHAVKDAMDNTTTLLSSLNLPSDGLELISADLETVSLPGEEQKIVKTAKVRWTIALQDRD